MSQRGNEAETELAGVRGELNGRVPVGVYVHFPWCLAKCPYCDFVSYAAERPAIEHARYADAVLAELAFRTRSSDGPGLDVGRYALASVFFGGGTPSLWEPRELGRVLAGILRAFPVHARAVEITAECNPSSLDEARARELHAVGVHRLSIGVQSLDAERLGFLGRLHDPRGALAAVRGAVRAGVPRVSADLIYAVPDEPPEEAAAEARALVDVGLSHLSAYALTIEPNTRFGELARRGRLPLADEGKAVASMFAVEEALAGAGLRRYEVSNFARPGEEARHNLGYWRGDDYLALGCAAYGTLSRDGGDAVRWRNDVAPSRYMDRALARPAELATQVESLDGETRLRERIMLGLRLTEGVDLARAARDLGASPWTAEREREAERLVARGRLRRDGDRLSVPRDAWIWVDDTAARLF